MRELPKVITSPVTIGPCTVNINPTESRNPRIQLNPSEHAVKLPRLAACFPCGQRHLPWTPPSPLGPDTKSNVPSIGFPKKVEHAGSGQNDSESRCSRVWMVSGTRSNHLSSGGVTLS